MTTCFNILRSFHPCPIHPASIYPILQLNYIYKRKMTTAIFRYFDPAALGSNPWTKVDGDITSFERVERRRSVSNIRDADTDFNVDLSGFAVYNSPSTVEPDVFFSTDDDDVIRTRYYPEVERLLRDKLGPKVKKIAIFDHTIRRHVPDAPRQPVQSVHVDQTPKAAETRVRRHLPADEIDDLLKNRFQLINVWRPIGHAATDFPLAVIDWRTASTEDVVKVDLLYPTRNRDIGDSNDDRGKEVLPDPEKAQDTTGYEVKGKQLLCVPAAANTNTLHNILQVS